MIQPLQSRNPSVKPRWITSVGVMESVVAYNCRKHGFPRPVLAAPMWEGAGKRAMDYSGYCHHGDIYGGCEWTRNGIHTHGSPGVIDVDYTIPTIATTDSFTWSALVYLQTGNSITSVIIGNRNLGTSSPLQFVKLTPSKFEYYHGGLLPGLYHTIPTEEWRHLIIVKDGADFTYYSNGVIVDTGSTTISMDPNPFYVGGDPNGNEYTNGEFGGVHLFDSALNPAQVYLLTKDPYLLFRIPEELYGYTVAAGGISIPVVMHHLRQQGIL